MKIPSYAVLLVVGACAASGAPPASGDPPSRGAGASGQSPPAGTPSGSSGGPDFGSDAAPRAQDQGCKKIDFLFVIDNSASMGAYQTQLIGAFGPFMDTIFSTVKAKDYNIMVVDSDAGEDIDTACEPCTPNSFWCGDWCTAKSGLNLACERGLGAGEVAPYNNEASNKVCGVPDGKRYLTSSLGQDEIKELFPCIAKVGIFGSGAEKPMGAMVEAVTTQVKPGACNEGFLRRDAVLVVTVITDDYPVPSTADDSSTVGTVQGWYDAVVAAKDGHPENVVMLGILNTADASCVSGAGNPIVHPTQKFVDLVGKFGPRGIAGNICTGDFNGFFKKAVSLIDTTCDDFVPPPPPK